MNAAYLDSAWSYVTSEPGNTLLRSTIKSLRLWTFNPDDDRAGRPVRLAAWAFPLVLALLGCQGVRPPPYILAYVGYATVMAFVFFALARHQVLMEIALIPLAGHGLARFCTFARLYQKERPLENP